MENSIPRGDVLLMAYDALVSLEETLEQIVNLDQYGHLKKQKVEYLLQKVSFILNFLEEYSEDGIEIDEILEDRIRDAAYLAQGIIESRLSTQLHSESENHADQCCSWKLLAAVKKVMPSCCSNLDRSFKRMIQEIDSIVEEVVKIQRSNTTEETQPSYSSHASYTAEDMQLMYSSRESSSTSAVSAKDNMQETHGDFMAIKLRLHGESSKLQLIPIVGMGGIGKTNLARQVYDDSLSDNYFDTCAWVTVSQEYCVRDMLLRILQCITTLSDEIYQKSDGQLADFVYKKLIGRRYLIVMDDMWSTEAWDDFKMIFPNDDSGSRIVLTTRLSEVALHVDSSSPLHEMHFLDDDQSWNLLREKVFAQDPCPQILDEVGKKIARNCRGLPLTIVVVAGLLSKVSETEEDWEHIAQNISLAEPTIDKHCSKILALSYDHLPLYLKPCFLYMTAFPEDYEIRIHRLIMLWVAEGFVLPVRNKSLEEVAEEYLEDLVKRNLVFVSKKRSNGKIKTVNIHDLLRELCVSKAEEDKFLHHVTERNSHILSERTRDHCRLSIHSKSCISHLRYIQGSHIHSLLFFFSHSDQVLTSILKFRLLSVLDAGDVSCSVFPNQIPELVSLRYLAFKYDFESYRDLPASISNLRNLQTLIIREGATHFAPMKALFLPPEIWMMPQLRHLILFDFSYLPNPSGARIDEENCFVQDLQTLSKVTNFKFSEESIKMLLNLKKLGLYYCCVNYENWGSYHLNNLVRLGNLEDLEFIVDSGTPSRYPDSVSVKFDFPPSLKRLVLDGCQFSWEDMTMVGSLPNLEVLKLKGRAFAGTEWKPVDEEFPRLRFLLIEETNLESWEAEDIHFPSLECLILKHCPHLWEIPSGIGEISTLQLIELHYCRSSVVASAKRIKKYRLEDMVDDTFKIRIYSPQK